MEEEPLNQESAESSSEFSSLSSGTAKIHPFKEGFIILLTMVGSIGGLLFGYDTGIIAGAQLYFKDTWPEITTVEREFTVSIALFGAFVSSLIAGPSSDAFGRKPVIMASDIIFVAGSLQMALSQSIPELMLGRLIIGLAIGIASMIVPVYLSELSPIQRRGTVVACFVIAITVGQLAASGIALACGRNWRLMLGLAIIPAGVQLIWMIFMPESQRWLARKSQHEDCLEVLNRVYDDDVATFELKQLKKEVHKMRHYIRQSECERYRQLFSIYSRCLVIGCGLQMFQQFIGINTVMYYGPEIIIDSGTTVDGVDDKEQLGIILNIPLAFTNAVGTTIAAFVIDDLGRRYIILRTLPGVFASLLLVAYSMYLSIYSEDPDQKNTGHILFMISIILYLAFFSIGFSSTPWAINSEIFPIHLVGTAVALATATNWLSNFIVASLFLSSMDTDAGKVYTFLILAGFTLLAFLFVYFLVPETAGKKITENIRNIIGDEIEAVQAAGGGGGPEGAEDGEE